MQPSNEAKYILNRKTVCVSQEPHRVMSKKWLFITEGKRDFCLILKQPHCKKIKKNNSLILEYRKISQEKIKKKPI
jgi:hypothetical protein